ncbi:SGNH/GDSL hydrolase family protein [Parvibium lacunae]|uniref:GDSL family lipase n=1 Tax=Parvibium lacunae TaxID=1888893 RepID=A0A368L557_9BURK|nr:SGNH/GDSL hydrolase family protein [Parvibium lacunae]RCS58719.1 GDSL family lipase [Parvibium lacunae]
METILVYGDSLAWGIIPDTRQRLPFEQRWPGVLELRLHGYRIKARVVEDCLNGRRTVWADPFKPGRQGINELAQRIEIHSPLALVILALGTNDFQATHQHDAWLSAQGIAACIQAIQQAPIEPGMPRPPILVVAPPPITQPRGAIAGKFKDAEKRCLGAADAYRRVCGQFDQVAFFDAADVAVTSPIDGVHLDAAEHQKLGLALAEVVAPLLSQARRSIG